MIRKALLCTGLGVGAALIGAGPKAMASPQVMTLVRGTAHQALFALATNGSAAIAVGTAGTIRESGDSGRTWKTVTPPPTALALLGVSERQGHAIAVGQLGTVLLRDGAGSWVKVESGTTNRLFAVSLNAGGEAVAVGAFGTIIHSGDGGKTWAAVAPDWDGYAEYGEQPHLYDVVVDDNGVITVVGEFGLILRSADGGKSWKTLHKGQASLFAIELSDDGSGYVVGQNGTVLRSSDGGAAWNEVEVPTHAILLGVHATAAGEVLITGMYDMLLSRDAGRSWSHVSGADISSSWYEGAGGSRTLLAVGHSGQIIQLTN